MTDREKTPPIQPPTDDEDVQRTLDQAERSAQRPHDDAGERERRREGAEEAERSPRREGEGIHPGSH
jgi:hypothetical protein